MRMLRTAAIGMVVVCLVATGCTEAKNISLATTSTTTTTTSTSTSGSNSATTTTVDSATAFTPSPITWKKCGRNECATVTVPLDYAQPTGRTIGLAVSRVRARGPRIGPLFVNPGGPGASAVELAVTLGQVLPGDILKHFDIVGVDPRGVGGTAPIHCGVPSKKLYGTDPTIEDQGDVDALLKVSNDYIADCQRKYADLLPHVGTRDVARDMDAVRAAMDDAKLSYLGYSYGTAIGQVYAELFPTHIRSMVIDGVLELGPTGLQSADEQAVGFEHALMAFAADCNSHSSCPIAPNAEQKITQVLQKAEATVPAPSADRPLGPGEASVGISYSMYDQSLWPALRSALSSALKGDGSALVRLADDYLNIASFEVYFAVGCLDQSWPRDPSAVLAAAKATAARSPHVGEAIVTDYIRCALWPTPPQPLDATTAPDAPPIVVISTTGDPATPYEGGVRTAARLTSGVLITNVGEGHTVFGTGKACIDNAVTAYLVDMVVPKDGMRCA